MSVSLGGDMQKRQVVFQVVDLIVLGENLTMFSESDFFKNKM